MASLTLAEAEQILAAAKAKVLEMGVKMSVSVVDPEVDVVRIAIEQLGEIENRVVAEPNDTVRH